jgi:hypothetical protein
MENGNVIYNNIDSLSDLEKEALDIYENGTKKELKNFFEKHFEEQYDYSFTNFKKDLFQKAKGYTKIENKVFTDALDEAFKQSSRYHVETYRKSKEKADKYFTSLGRTKEAQDMILDYIANDIDIDSDALIKANAKYFETQNVNHGLYAFSDDIFSLKGPTDNPLERIDDNIRDIINDKQMEMSLSSNEYMIGPIGVTGKTSPIAYHVNDMRSRLEFSFDGAKRIPQENKKRGTGTIADIMDVLEQEDEFDLFAGHDELIGKGLDIESLWVKEDFYSENQDYVHSLMQKYKINNLDIIHASENTEKISSSQIERISIDDINKKKKLTPQEAFNKYGPNDDRFYTSQGLDPKEQKEKIDELNSKRKPIKTDKEILDEISNSNSKEYERIKKEFEDIGKEIENTKKEIENTKKEIENTKKEIENTKKEIENLEKNTTKEVVENTKTVEQFNNDPREQIPFDDVDMDLNELNNLLSGTTSSKTYEKELPKKEVVENTKKELPKKELSKASTEAIEAKASTEATEDSIKNINFKKVGKIGLVAAAIGIGAYAIGNHNKNKENQQTQRQVQYPQNNSYIDNSYAQQMASDISSYKYGKHMTGFVN